MAKTEYIVKDLDLKVPIIKENVVITKIGDGSVVSPSYEDESEPYIITLNDTGTFIFFEIDGIKTVKELVEKMISHYDIDYINAKEDLYELVKDLEEGKIIVWKE